MHDPDYLHYLIQQGKLNRDDVKRLRKKDLGECELLAIAKASKGEYWMVSNDLGRVYMHPEQNIFESYEGDSDVTVLLGMEWIKRIGYEEE